ncbi:hypothetical protein IV102_15930 [bacterium]|nr:hypothetical protein [bacterium]
MSLLEVIVALALLAMILPLILNLLPTSMLSLRRAERLQIATTLASYRMDEANLVDPRPGVDVDEIVPLSSRRYHVVRQFYAIDSERIDVVVSVTLLDTDLPPVSLASRLLRAATP